MKLFDWYFSFTLIFTFYKLSNLYENEFLEGLYHLYPPSLLVVLELQCRFCRLYDRKKFSPWLSPIPGSPLKSIEKACALWIYAIDRKPVDNAMEIISILWIYYMNALVSFIYFNVRILQSISKIFKIIINQHSFN